MSEGDRQPFWDRFDIHIKRWQTVCALIVALGAIVGFGGSKLGWHWPTSWGSSDKPVTTEAVSTLLRYQSKDWGTHIDITGLNPTFDVASGYDNQTDQTVGNVILNLSYDSRLELVPGTGVMTEGNHPHGVPVDDGLTDKGIDVGFYAPKANVFVRTSLRIPSDKFPCGDSTVPIRTLIRIGEQGFDQARYGPEAFVAYHKVCDTHPTSSTSSTTQ